MKKIRWGFLGAGILLERWMKGFLQVEDAEIAAIASRTPQTARRMADRFGIPDALSYDEILKRKDIDIMYIPVPHPAHKELAIRAMEAGFPGRRGVSGSRFSGNRNWRKSIQAKVPVRFHPRYLRSLPGLWMKGISLKSGMYRNAFAKA